MNDHEHNSLGQFDMAEVSAQQNNVWPRPALPPLSALSQLTHAAHANHLIAVSRIICAIILLVFAMTDPAAPGFQFEFDDLFALAYGCLALTTLIISLKSWYVDFTFSEAFILADTLAFIVLVIPHTLIDSGAVAPSLCLMAHILSSSFLRGGARLAFAVGVFLNTFWITDIVLFELPRGNIDQGIALRWILVAIVGSLIVVWASVRISTTPLPRFEVNNPRPDLPLAGSAIDYAVQASRASDAILCWIDPDHLGGFVCNARTTEERLPPEKLGFIATEALKTLNPMLFDVSRSRAVISEDGKFSAHRALPLPVITLLKELGVKSGICVPIDSTDERNWLILTGIPMLGWGHLQLANDICAEVAHGINWQTASTNAHDAAIFRLRQTVARDLHDSVAHSLAGARFLLVALRSKVADNPKVAEEIDSIRTALDAEHLHVRRLIAQLRETDSDTHRRNLIEDLEAIRPIVASRWQIEVEMLESDYRIDVPGWFSLEVQQLVRETISNAVRHGKATQITINCKSQLKAIRLKIADNGSGFPNPESPVSPRSISERIYELGGVLDIESNTQSTTLRISIPLDRVN